MTGNGRNLALTRPIPVSDVVWVPVWDIPMRDDDRDRIQPDTEKAAT